MPPGPHRFGPSYSFAVAALLLFATTVPALAQLSGDAKPFFEVASVKAARPMEGTGGFRIRNGRFTGESVTLRLLVAIAYGLQDSQVTGGPGWASSDMFDVEAKGESGRETADEVRQMLQQLLADRFKLAVHKETK